MSCRECFLRDKRKRLVVGRGVWPCRILFIGEAPGKTEEVMGKAFVGQAGQLLEKIFAKASELSGLPMPEYYITNTLLCRPVDFRGGENRAPHPDEMNACRENVDFIIEQARPKEIIFLGAVAQKFYGKIFKQAFHLTHPAHILRKGGKSSPDFIRVSRELSEILITIDRR
jgi:DNA polymerase